MEGGQDVLRLLGAELANSLPSSATLCRQQDAAGYQHICFSSKSRAFGPQLFWRSDGGLYTAAEQRAPLAPPLLSLSPVPFAFSEHSLCFNHR